MIGSFFLYKIENSIGNIQRRQNDPNFRGKTIERLKCPYDHKQAYQKAGDRVYFKGYIFAHKNTEGRQKG